jgi:hypothetical protein
MFTKVHGHGIYIYRGVSKLEATGGANFGLECIYRTVLRYLKEKRKYNPNHRINNIYLTGDNARANKCWTTYGGCAALVAYGICIKAKLTFGLANHNHTDIDAAIGNNCYYITHFSPYTLFDRWMLVYYLQAP